MSAGGAEAASDGDDVRSPETYLGYARAENFVSPDGGRMARLPIAPLKSAFSTLAPKLTRSPSDEHAESSDEMRHDLRRH